MHGGQGQHALGPYGRVSRWFGSQHGHFMLDAAVAVALMAIVLAQSWARYSPVTRWRGHNTVHAIAQVLERDLRFTQQTAISSAGTGSHAELCLRPDGYDIYAVAHLAATGSTVASGIRIKGVTWAKDYVRGIAITADRAATHNCTADPTRPAFVYLASGAPKFHDDAPHRLAVTFRGHTLHVTIQPIAGTTRVGP